MSLRYKRFPQVGPGCRGRDRGQRQPLDRGPQEETAAVRRAVSADVLGVDRMIRGQPGEQLAQVGELARAVEREEPFGLAVRPRVVGQDCVAVRREKLCCHPVWRPVDEV